MGSLAWNGVLAGLLGIGCCGAAQAEQSRFDGLYVGAEVGIENVVGGALVDGEDILAQDSRPAVTAFAGYRHQFGDRLVLGAEAGVAREDGDLCFSDAGSGTEISYRNGAHWRLGAIAGWALGEGRNSMIFVYVNETKRNFDVEVEQGAVSFSQRDEQGLLRYGLGVEHAFDRWSLRATIGSSRGDFGDQATNIEPDRPLDFSLAVIPRF